MIIIPQAPTLRGSNEQMLASVQKYLRELSEVLPMAFEEASATSATETKQEETTTVVKQEFELVQTSKVSSFTQTGVYYPPLGICAARLSLKLSAALSAGSGVSVAGIPSDYAPVYRAALSGYCENGPAFSVMASPTSGIYMYTKTAIPTTSYIYINGFWFV